MTIKKMILKNFKSFRNLVVELGEFNVIIGANAAGKSNFVQSFKFLRDLSEFGLDNAVSMQGGAEHLRNVNIGSDEDFSITVVSDEKYSFHQSGNNKFMLVKIHDTSYEFALKFNKKGAGFCITKDRITQRCSFVKYEKSKGKIDEKEKLGDGKIIFFRADNKIKVEIVKPEEIQLKKEDILPPLPMAEIKLESKELLFNMPIFFIFPLQRALSRTSIYDFDPKLPKKATPITGKAELEEDGGNLSIVIKNIVEDKDKKRKLFNLAADLMPFIEGLDVEKFADKSLLFKLRETYSRSHYLPASLISDGTINMTALIIALFFENKPLLVIEEPERNIHPNLIARVIEIMKDASRNKQIITTTHNPEVVRHAGLENILLVSRDKEGFSTISRPNDKREVRTFLKNEIGVEELFVQNLLGD